MQSPRNNRSFTQLMEFDIEPQWQQALVTALSEQTERLARDHQGFLSASIQASEDGRRVLNYLQWQSRATALGQYMRRLVGLAHVTGIELDGDASSLVQ